MEFSRQGYWSGLPFLSPGDLPNPGIKPRPPALWADSLPSELSGKPEIKQSSFYFTLCLSERQWCPWLQNQCFHTASRMSARAIESGEGHALGSLLLELLPEGECPWGSSRGWMAQSLGFLGGQRGSGFWPGGATWCSGSIKALSPGSQLVLCAGRTPSSPRVLGLPLSVISLVHLQAPLTPLSSAPSVVPSLHQRSWGLQERVEGAVRGLFRQPPALLCAPPLFLSSRGRRIFPVKQPDL